MSATIDPSASHVLMLVMQEVRQDSRQHSQETRLSQVGPSNTNAELLTLWQENGWVRPRASPVVPKSCPYHPPLA